MTASLVLINARLWSPDGVGAGCDAIVAEGGRITALTTGARARAQVGPGTRVIDLGGRLAIPAFGDAHVHPVGGGLESLRCDLTGPRDRALPASRPQALAGGARGGGGRSPGRAAPPLR